MSSKMGEEALFETKAARGLTAYKLFSATILTGIVLTWIYRFTHIPRTGERGRYAWILMFVAEFLFALYWIITRSVRLNVVHRYPFKDRLSSRYGDKLPLVDVFVCTADHMLEPPSLVMNTVLSVLSYNYPPEKLTVYLSDDGGSQLTFYALFEVSKFSKHWIPFCKKYNVEPRSPQFYFAARNIDDARGSSFDQEWTRIKKLYDDMKSRIDLAVAKNSVSKEVMDQHKGFSEWDSADVTKQNHQSIVQILIDGWNPNAVDVDGNRLPSVVYVSREKRPGFAHNFKAGSLNSLIRVSGEISNAPVILNLDCDMYANDPDAVRDALCFLLGEKGQSISYVQHPQNYHNITKNDVYANINRVVNQVELAGLDGQGGTLYIGTGCFHRRESLSGKTYSGNHKIELHDIEDTIKGRTVEELEESSKMLATCSYEKNTLWGKEMGLVYGCPVEDIVTGLTIQCRGWKPAYYIPTKSAFLGLAPTSLDVALVQFKRWSEGMFQIFFSKYCPFIYGRGKIGLAAQMGYCIYLLWAPVSIPMICYVVVPALCLLHAVPLFPKVSSLWFVPFAYVFAAHNASNLAEDLICGNTLNGWWNLQRMVVIRRMTSYLFAFIDTIKRTLGLSETEFVLTDKVVDEEKRKRYERGIIEFAKTPSLILTIITTVAMLNLASLALGITRALFFDAVALESVFEMVFCGALVLLNLPVYEAFLVRSDEGRIPSHVVLKSVVIASVASLVPIY